MLFLKKSANNKVCSIVADFNIDLLKVDSSNDINMYHNDLKLLSTFPPKDLTSKHCESQ